MIDFSKILEYCILLTFWYLLVVLPHYFMVLRYARKCSYDCSSCKASDCMAKNCLEKRSKL